MEGINNLQYEGRRGRLIDLERAQDELQGRRFAVYVSAKTSENQFALVRNELAEIRWVARHWRALPSLTAGNIVEGQIVRMLLRITSGKLKG